MLCLEPQVLIGRRKTVVKECISDRNGAGPRSVLRLYFLVLVQRIASRRAESKSSLI